MRTSGSGWRITHAAVAVSQLSVELWVLTTSKERALRSFTIPSRPPIDLRAMGTASASSP